MRASPRLLCVALSLLLSIVPDATWAQATPLRISLHDAITLARTQSTAAALAGIRAEPFAHLEGGP